MRPGHSGRTSCSLRGLLPVSPPPGCSSRRPRIVVPQPPACSSSTRPRSPSRLTLSRSHQMSGKTGFRAPASSSAAAARSKSRWESDPNGPERSRSNSPALPPAYSPVQVVAQGRLPVTHSGGVLLFIGGPAQATPKAALAGQPVRLDSVWSEHSNWPCPWTAWRADVRPDPAPRDFTLTFEQPGSARPPEITTLFLPK